MVIDPVELVETIEEMYRAQAIAEGLDLRLELRPDLPRAVLLDPIRVEQVLRNLMSNAIKFTPEGQITLELDSHQTPTGERRLILGVEDTGIGIPEQQQAKLSMIFHQNRTTFFDDPNRTRNLRPQHPPRPNQGRQPVLNIL